MDIDRDGDMDLVIASATSDDLVLLRNDGAANFAAPVTIVSGWTGSRRSATSTGTTARM